MTPTCLVALGYRITFGEQLPIKQDEPRRLIVDEKNSLHRHVTAVRTVDCPRLSGTAFKGLRKPPRWAMGVGADRKRSRCRWQDFLLSPSPCWRRGPAYITFRSRSIFPTASAGHRQPTHSSLLRPKCGNPSI